MMEKHGIQDHSTFTGKERDEETGYGYFGARYMDHELMTMWLSVDPMSDKYPGISPYAYCAWNPVKLIDSDGREWDKPEDEKQARKIEKAVNNRISDISKEIQSKKDRINDITNNTKLKPSKKLKKLTDLNNELSDLEYQKGLLEDFIIGLGELEKSETKYSFNPSKEVFQQNTFLETNGVISINYQDHPLIGMANLVHETTHAIQDYRHQLHQGNLMFCEINAYSTQYAYSPDSFNHIFNYINPSPRISEAWVRGVYYIKDGKQVYPYRNIK